MDKVIVTRSFCNIFTMQVCAEQDATDDEILAVCNRENPAGTTNGWGTVVRDESDYPDMGVIEGHQQSVAPVTCESYPDRKHFLVLC